MNIDSTIDNPITAYLDGTNLEIHLHPAGNRTLTIVCDEKGRMIDVGCFFFAGDSPDQAYQEIKNIYEKVYREGCLISVAVNTLRETGVLVHNVTARSVA